MKYKTKKSYNKKSSKKEPKLIMVGDNPKGRESVNIDPKTFKANKKVKPFISDAKVVAEYLSENLRIKKREPEVKHECPCCIANCKCCDHKSGNSAPCTCRCHAS